MRLSEAIRLGAMLHPQHFGSARLYDVDADMAIIGTCAIGAAEEAGYSFWVPDETLNANARCPQCDCWSRDTTRALIPHLNDDHRWTREAIADWVELQEGLKRADAQSINIPAARSPAPVCVDGGDRAPQSSSSDKSR